MTDTPKTITYSVESSVQAMLDFDAPVSFYGSTLTLPVERRFADIPSLQRYVDLVLSHPGVIAAFDRDTPFPSVTVTASRTQRKAVYVPARRQIRIPVLQTWALREFIVLHELAHHVDSILNPFLAATTDHGQTFRDAYLTLLHTVMAPEVALLMQIGYSERGLVSALPHQR